MRIQRIRLRQIRMPLLHDFQTSFGRTRERSIILVEVVSEGVSGWGEVTASEDPFYNEEWTLSAWALLSEYFGPALLGQRLNSAAETWSRLPAVRGHNMAKGGLEAAVWDLEARLSGEPLYRHIGGVRREISCGVSIGIQETVEELLERIAVEVEAGYQRIKIKIKPGWDGDVVRRVRDKFPNIRLMADANAAYRLADAEHLRELDAFHLMMLEQPLAHDDLIDHAALQAKLATPICLDESIRSARHAEQALRIGACRIINIKLGRVGGFAEARRVHDVAEKAGAPVWCGGMLEAGVGRAHNIALSTLPNFVLPGDVSASKRYWKRDIIEPPVEVTGRGTILLREEPGIGYGIDLDYLHRLTVRRKEIG